MRNTGCRKSKGSDVRRWAGIAFLTGFWLLSFPISEAAATAPPPRTAVSESSGDHLIKELLTTGGQLQGYGLNLPDLRRFYEGRNFDPAWSSAANADVAIATLQGAAADGLDPRDYRADAITARRRSASNEGRAEFDVLLTNGLLAYIHDMRVGRVVPDGAGFPIDLPLAGYDAVAGLTDAIRNQGLAGYLSGLAPPHPEYNVLKAALARYRKIEAEGGWPEIAAFTPIDLDGNDPRIPLLMRRLAFEDLSVEPDRTTSAELASAIVRYQTQHGLEPDGIAGKETLDALNTPASVRADQIVANMERWRWLPRPFEQTHVEVNTADATLMVIDHGKIVLGSRVITGKPESPTPVFKAWINGITVNPSWNIPDRIAENEIWPKARRISGYFSSQRIVADRPGGKLRQLPGDNNSLGRIKIEMPNRFDSYLHDTPARSLFAKTHRHFSHGCMRVEQIQPLASFVMSGDANAASEKITEAIATGETHRLAISKPIPVYVLYWTVLADEAGTVEFWPDAYGLDSRVLAALEGQRPVGRVSMLTDCTDSGRA